MSKHREGPAHWWAMKLSSVALVPLGLWFAFQVIHLASMDQAAVAAFLRQPLNACAMGFFLLISLYHSATGIQVVMEDYISTTSTRRIALFISNALHMVAAAFGFLIVLHALGVGIHA